MKLHEITRRYRTSNDEIQMLIEPAAGEFGEFEATIEYEYEPESSTQHEPSDPTTREHHSAQVNIYGATADEEFHELLEDDTFKTWDKGTDLTKMSFWTDKFVSYLEEKILESLDDGRDDY